MAKIKGFGGMNIIGLSQSVDPVQSIIAQIQAGAGTGYQSGQQLGMNLLEMLGRERTQKVKAEKETKAEKRSQTREDLQRAQMTISGYKAKKDTIQKEYFPQGIASLKQWETEFAKKDPQQFSAINKKYKEMIDYDLKISKLLKKYSPIEQKQILQQNNLEDTDPLGLGF